MATVACDIDDTLYSFTDLAREVMYDIYLETGDEVVQQASYALWPEWRSPPDLLGGDIKKWLDIIEICHRDDNIMSRVPYAGAQETLWALWREGHDLLYISNRREDSAVVTGAWLNMRGFPIAADGNVELRCTMGDKRKHMVDCQYLIDDRPKTLIDFTTDFDWRDGALKSEERVAFALQRPYNNQLTDWPAIKIAPNWRGIEHYLTKEGLISEASDSSGAARDDRATEVVR